MSAGMTAYRTERQAQDARYETLTGLPIGETERQEFRDYFGVGDHAGRPAETRVTPKLWMQQQAGEREPVDVITDRQAFTLNGVQLAVLAAAGDYNAAAEIVRRAIKRAGVAA